MKNKRILITGGSSGIGKAAAIELAKQGAEIIIQARNTEKLKIAAEEIKNYAVNKVHYYSTDLTSATSVEEAAEKIIKEVGLPEVIINSAGAGEWLSLKEATTAYFESSMASPYLTTSFTCKAFYDRMQERGTGHFVIINSAACFFSFKAATGYTAARWAMLGLAKTLQADLFNSEFKVSMVALGKVDSPYFTTNPVSEERIPKIVSWLMPAMTTEQSGKVIKRVVNRPKNMLVRPIMMDICVRLNRIFPGIFRWLMRVTG